MGEKNQIIFKICWLGVFDALWDLRASQNLGLLI